jgi:hypothetical protein
MIVPSSVTAGRVTRERSFESCGTGRLNCWKSRPYWKERKKTWYQRTNKDERNRPQRERSNVIIRSQDPESGSPKFIWEAP